MACGLAHHNIVLLLVQTVELVQFSVLELTLLPCLCPDRLCVTTIKDRFNHGVHVPQESTRPQHGFPILGGVGEGGAGTQFLQWHR